MGVNTRNIYSCLQKYNTLNKSHLVAQLLNSISCLYMFRAPCAHRQEVKIVLYSLCVIKPIGGRPVRRLREDSLNLCTGRPPTGVMIPDAV